VIEGVDPALVFRIRTAGRLSSEQWGNRGLELLSEGGDWDYVVLSPGKDTPKVAAELTRYAAAPDREKAKATLSSFFWLIEAIEPYGPEDRLAEEIAKTLDTHPGPMDILIWAATDDAEAARRIAQVTTVLEAQKATITATDRRARSPVIRAILDGPTARLIANIAVVELMRSPLLPYVDPSDWRDIGPDELAGEHNGGVPIGVLDDAIATGHPLLGTLVSATRSFPSGHPWQQPGPHGTMVAGLALYGDLETRLRDHLPFDSSGSVVQGRVIEPRPTQPHLHQFPQEQPEYMTIEEAIVALNEDHGVRVFVLSVTENDPYSGPRVSLLTERLDDLIRERDLVVVVATGNHAIDGLTAQVANGQHVLHDYPVYALDETGRVSEPAAAALAVTVGSIARSAGPATLAGITPHRRRGSRARQRTVAVFTVRPGGAQGNKAGLRTLRRESRAPSRRCDREPRVGHGRRVARAGRRRATVRGRQRHKLRRAAGRTDRRRRARHIPGRERQSHTGANRPVGEHPGADR
jgi:hypothetical protein